MPFGVTTWYEMRQNAVQLQRCSWAFSIDQNLAKLGSERYEKVIRSSIPCSEFLKAIGYHEQPSSCLPTRNETNTRMKSLKSFWINFWISCWIIFLCSTMCRAWKSFVAKLDGFEKVPWGVLQKNQQNLTRWSHQHLDTLDTLTFPPYRLPLAV